MTSRDRAASQPGAPGGPGAGGTPRASNEPSAKHDILARVRRALAGTTPPGEIARTYRQAREGDLDEAALVDVFAERVTDYRASVYRAAPGAVAATVEKALADGLSGRVDGDRPRVVVPAGLPTAWHPGNADVVVDDNLDAATLDGVQGVITGAAVAIAETGTIVLDGSPDQGRRAITLVPDLHVCVVRASEIVASVPDGVASLEATRPQTWISGPSATSDIELDRVEGVHGPRTLHVVLASDTQDASPR